MTADLLLLLTFALSMYGTGQVWLVQVSSYPLWECVGDEQFERYHNFWWRSIWGVILAPAGLSFLCALLMLRWATPATPQVALWAGLGLQLALMVGTAAWWGPLMARLEDEAGGLDQRKFRLLLSTHWLRVALVTAYSLVVAWIMFLNLAG